jgi:hypothetical protein
MINRWAARWGIPLEAMAELRASMVDVVKVPAGMSEAAAQQRVKLEAGRRGMRLWRNNNGACVDAKTERVIRYGLANDSKQMNSKLKSSDLIGIIPIVVTPAHVGHTIGMFASVEMKKPGWRYSGNGREKAQLAWLEMVATFGGFAKFATSEGDL